MGGFFFSELAAFVTSGWGTFASDVSNNQSHTESSYN